MESQFRRLQASLEGLYSHRRELAFATAALGKGLALLSNGEDHAGLSRALAKMAELHDKVFQIGQPIDDNSSFMKSFWFCS